MKTLLSILACLLFLVAAAQVNYILRGNQFYKSGQFEQAEINYRKALESDPDNATALHNLANALYRQGKFEEAAGTNTTLTKSTKDKSARSAAFYNQGVAHSRLNHLEPSIESYKNALKLNPADQQARENLQKALLQLKKQQQQDKKKQQSSNMSQKQADQKLQQLQQRERELQQKMNQKNQSGGGSQDW